MLPVMVPAAAGPRPVVDATCSNQVPWTIDRREWFAEGGLVFDVTLLKRHLATHRVPVRPTRLDDLSAWLHASRATVADGARSAVLRQDRVAGADPSLPLVVAEVRGRRYLVDGHHRLEQAQRTGRRSVPLALIQDPLVVRAALRRRSALASYWWHGRLAPRIRAG